MLSMNLLVGKISKHLKLTLISNYKIILEIYSAICKARGIDRKGRGHTCSHEHAHMSGTEHVNTVVPMSQSRPPQFSHS